MYSVTENSQLNVIYVMSAFPRSFVFFLIYSFCCLSIGLSSLELGQILFVLSPLSSCLSLWHPKARPHCSIIYQKFFFIWNVHCKLHYSFARCSEKGQLKDKKMKVNSSEKAELKEKKSLVNV